PAVRVQPHAQHADAPRWTEHELPRQLAREDDGRLTLDPAVGMKALERIAEVDDQLGPPVGNDRLDVAAELRGVALERPDAMDERRQIRRRRELVVLHDSPERITTKTRLLQERSDAIDVLPAAAQADTAANLDLVPAPVVQTDVDDAIDRDDR